MTKRNVLRKKMAVSSVIKLLAAVMPCLLLAAFCLPLYAHAQEGATQQTPPAPKKINERASAPAAAAAPVKAEPFDGATTAQMSEQCVTLETTAGRIVIEMLAEAAPETARNFLNLVAAGALDTTTFSRVVKGFVVQGGNLSTSERWGAELSQRARRTIADEPNYVKHIRGVVSMARPETPNSATTHFFILVGDASQLDGKFAAFGRVTSGMEVVDAINQMPGENEKPEKPVRITRAQVAGCTRP